MADTPILNYKGKYDGPEIDKAVELALGLDNPKSCPYYVHISLSKPDYVLTIGLGDAEGNPFNHAEIDLPLESMVVNATYENGNIILHLQDGTSTEPIPISALIAGLVSENRTIAGIDLKDNITQKELRDALDVYTKDSVDQLVSDLENRIDETLNEHDTQIKKNTSDIAINKSDILSAEKAIEINQRSIGMQVSKNLFDYAKWESSINSVDKGTFEKHGDGITISAIDYDAYTSPYAASHTNIYKIPVKPNTKYILSWESDNDNDGKVYIFKNAVSSSGKSGNNKDEKSLDFETNSNTTFITVRFGVMYAGESITYSNIMIREADITDNTYEPYKPSINERLVEVEESISELTPQMEQNTSDITTNKSDILRIYQDTQGASLNSVGWYRIFEVNKLSSRRSAIINIARGYGEVAGETITLLLNLVYMDGTTKFADCNVLDKLCRVQYLDKIRVVAPTPYMTSNIAYIDLHYNTTKPNNVNAVILGINSGGKNVTNFTPINLTKINEIGEGYTAIEFDLTGGDIFDRLTALETALTQTE